MNEKQLEKARKDLSTVQASLSGHAQRWAEQGMTAEDLAALMPQSPDMVAAARTDVLRYLVGAAQDAAAAGEPEEERRCRDLMAEFLNP